MIETLFYWCLNHLKFSDLSLLYRSEILERLKAFYLYTDHTQWDSVEKGPHLPVTTVGDATVRNTNPKTYNERDKKLIERDNKAFGALFLCLSSEIHNRFGEQKNAKDLYDALYLTNRFLTVTSNLKKYDQLTTVEQVIKLLDSLPPEWSLQVRMLKQERMFTEYKLIDVINKLKSFELDIKRREYNQAVYPPMQTQNAALLSSTSESSTNISVFSYISGNVPMERKNVGKDQVASQVPNDMMAFFGIFVNSYEALIARYIKGKGITMEDMLQVDPDDLKEADIQWQMAMLNVWARRFMERTRKRSFGNQNAKVGFDKSKLRCFNCKQLRHFKRDCPSPTVFEPSSPNIRNVVVIERENNKVQEEIHHALVVETILNAGSEYEKTINKATEEIKREETVKVEKESKMDEDEKEEERKRNTQACNCEKGLATEKIIMGLPYEVIQDMC
ncbi:hypothetical protein QVD17_19745 [Tagetes erecta]|uniref:CCHC-type domain-containing protein n=1 Tax=Tagetes erecta TaxID=13708 RepID=A0AAD8KN87_TARER|nr:hypothetical protein QVD17_19745 [Tagetes erecta]